jgi:dTDP-4-amino-4,6-dideoxygalactose transaminase
MDENLISKEPQYLANNGIETKVQHSFLMTQHDAYRGKIKGDILNAERLVARILSVPNHGELEKAAFDFVAARIRDFHVEQSGKASK